MEEIIFSVTQSDEGHLVASALNHSIITDGENIIELRQHVKDAVRCHFDDDQPKIIRLHQVTEEVFSI